VFQTAARIAVGKVDEVLKDVETMLIRIIDKGDYSLSLYKEIIRAWLEIFVWTLLGLAFIFCGQQ